MPPQKNKTKRLLTEADLKQGFASLEALSLVDYRASLSTLWAMPDEKMAAHKIGRLVGVVLKEPFSQPLLQPIPSQYSGSYRNWNLDENAFSIAEKHNCWQYATLEKLKEENGMYDVKMFALHAYNERGFFKYLLKSVAKYLCGDQKLRKEIESQIRKLKKDGLNVPNITPEWVVASGGILLGNYLIQTVPLLGTVGVPVIAGLVLIIYRIGLDGFCEWSNSLRDEAEIEK
jgi:hypothetical protein